MRQRTWWVFVGTAVGLTLSCGDSGGGGSAAGTGAAATGASGMGVSGTGASGVGASGTGVAGTSTSVAGSAPAGGTGAAGTVAGTGASGTGAAGTAAGTGASGTGAAGTAAGTGASGTGAAGTAAGTGAAGTAAGTGAAGTAAGTGGGGPLTLTSTAFANGEEIPDSYRCDAGSPELSWTGAPDGTMSFGIVLTDMTLPGIHWVIYDIPADVTMLAEGVPQGPMPATPAGAKQGAVTPLIATFVGVDAVRFIGPCAGAGNMNMYQFKLYALDVAELPNVSAGDPGDAIETELIAHAIETATLDLVSVP